MTCQVCNKPIKQRNNQVWECSVVECPNRKQQPSLDGLSRVVTNATEGEQGGSYKKQPRFEE